MIANMHCTSRCVAIFFTLFGTVFIIAWLVNPVGNYSNLLESAAYAGGVSVTALLLDMLLNLLGGKQLLPSMLLSPVTPGEQATEDGQQLGEWSEIAHRRQLLEERLQIDEPRICSFKGIPCTCWSFCGGDPGLSADSVTTEFVPLKQVALSDENPESREDPLPTIERSNVKDCPFS